MPYISNNEFIQNMHNHVMSKQDLVLANAHVLRDNATKAATDVVKTVAQMKLGGISSPPAPNIPELKIGNLQLPNIDVKDLGRLPFMGRSHFNPQEIPAVVAPNIEDYRLHFPHLNYPAAPKALASPNMPTAPQHKDLTLPQAPALHKPRLPVLQELVIPAFSYTPLAPFQDDNPQFIASSVSSVLQWQEMPYQPVLMDEEIAVVRRMWAGGTGLPPAVEQALWERAAAREDVACAREVSDTMVEFSSRGFSLPPGALLARVDAIRTEHALQKQTLARDILIKITDTHIENLRFACQQAIAAENVLIGLWSQMAQRAFEAAKVQLDAQVAVLNARIAAYNAQQNARQISAAVRKMELDERAHELQVQKMRLEGELAKGQINEQRIKIFSQLWQAVALEVDIYKSQMQGAAIEADVQKKEVDIYRAQVEAVGERLKADKLRFDAYDSQMRGESAKIQMVQAQAQAYSAYVSGKATAADIKFKNQAAAVQQQQLQLNAFIANIEADKAHVQAQLAEITTKAEVHKVNTQRYVAQAGAQSEAARVQIAAWQAQAQANIAQWEGQMRKVIADMEQMMRAAAMQVEAVKMLAQTHATLAAGAMAGVSFSASLGASTNSGNSASYSENHSYQHDVD